jgi:hypothetical protein
MHAYDALGKLGGLGTTFMLGDWSKLPNWLFPHVPGFESAFAPWYTLPGSVGAASMPAASAQGKVSQNLHASTAGSGNPYP